MDVGAPFACSGSGLEMLVKPFVLAGTALLLLAPAAMAGQVRFDGEGHAMHPVWSPDGKFLAFEVNRLVGDVDLFIAAISGDLAKDAVRVTLPGGSNPFGGTGQVVANPVFLKDNMSVFEGSNQGGQFRIYYRAATGGAAAEMVPTTILPGHLTFPAVSPDSRSMVFVSSATGSGDIRSRDTQSGQIGQLTTTPVSEMFPLYSPDGSMLLFSRKNDGGQDVYEMPIAGGAETLVAGGAGDQTRPGYTADDGVVWFDGSRGEDHWDLVAMVGTTKKTLARDVRLPHRARPALSLDGRWVAWTWSDPVKGSKVVIARVDGSKTVEIETGLTAAGEPALGVQAGRTLLAFTALPSSGSDFRFLTVVDVTDKLQ